MTRRSRRAAAAAVLVLSVAGLSACGENAATSLVDPDNAEGATPQGGIVARAFVLVKSPNAPAAALSGTLINRGDAPDTLETITLTPDGVPGAQAITIRPNIVLQPDEVRPFGTPGHDPISVPNAQNLKLGHFVDLLMHFKNSGDIKTQVETHKREGFYSDVLPSTQANPSASPRSRTQRNNGSAAVVRPTPGATEPSSEQQGTNPGDTGTLNTDSSGEEATDTSGAAVSKSTTTTTPSAKAADKRAAKRAAAKRAAAKAAREAEAAKRTTRPAPATTAPVDPAVEPAHAPTDHGGGH